MDLTRDRERGSSAVPAHHRGYPLTNMAFRTGIHQQLDIRMIMSIDEPGTHHPSFGIDDGFGPGWRNPTDLRDHIAANPDVGRYLFSARPVEYPAASDQHIEILPGMTSLQQDSATR